MKLKQMIVGVGITLIMQNIGAMQYCLNDAELEMDKPIVGAFTPNEECDQTGEFIFENLEGISSPIVDIQVVSGTGDGTQYPIQVDIYAEGKNDGGASSKLIASLSKNGITQIKLQPSTKMVAMVWDKVCNSESNQQIIYTIKLSKKNGGLAEVRSVELGWDTVNHSDNRIVSSTFQTKN